MTRPAKYAYLDHPGLLAFAHRGGALEAPENTMKAFEYAVELGYRYLETDAYATQDGVLISFHDDKLDRVSDSKGAIEALTWGEVRKARIGGGEPVPLMEELFERFPDVRINIDPKHDAAVAPLIALIKRMGAEGRVCIGSFSGKRIKQVQDAFDGRVCTSLGPGGCSNSSQRRRAYRFGGGRRAAHRSRSKAAGLRSSRDASSKRRSAMACRCTSGRSTTRRKCAA